MTRTNMFDQILDIYWENQFSLSHKQKKYALLILVLDILILISGLLHNQSTQSQLVAMVINLVDAVMPIFCLTVCCILAFLGKAALNDFTLLCRMLRIRGVTSLSLFRFICTVSSRLYRPCLVHLCVFILICGILSVVMHQWELLLVMLASSGCHFFIWFLTCLFLQCTSNPDK